MNSRNAWYQLIFPSLYMENLFVWLYSPLLSLGSFFSFLIVHKVGRAPWTGISPPQGIYLHTEQHKHRINSHNTDIHALSGIRTHDPTVRASEDSSYLSPRGHCDRHTEKYHIKSFTLSAFSHKYKTSFPLQGRNDNLSDLNPK
jgi:hypothetical protein